MDLVFMVKDLVYWRVLPFQHSLERIFDFGTFESEFSPAVWGWVGFSDSFSADSRLIPVYFGVCPFLFLAKQVRQG